MFEPQTYALMIAGLGLVAAAWLGDVGCQATLNSRIFRSQIEPQLVAWRDEKCSAR